MEGLVEGWNIQSFVFSLILPFLDTPPKNMTPCTILCIVITFLTEQQHLKKNKNKQLMATTDLSKSTGADTQTSSRLEDNPFYEARKLDLSTLGTC